MELKRISEVAKDLEELASTAQAEGHGNVMVLVSEFRSSVNRFALPGEAMFGAYVNEMLVGVGGLNIDPYYANAKIGRVRRLYIHHRWRREGIGAEMMRRIEGEAARQFSVLQLFTTSELAGAFYESLGYLRQTQYKVSHAKHLSA
ncbi:MAG: GNAT family N-acetyltransferase [Burkholderiaceae bacterium]